jgi:PAS domain-containing protein
MDALATGDVCHSLLDRLPVPIYTTDEAGAVTYWNRACVDFAGREPRLGEDRWCVTWKICTPSGDPMPHDQCPMAQAIRERREVRGTVAMLTGAVNMLIDVSAEQADVLAEQARRCRRLADATYDRQTCVVLSAMADEFAKTAADLSA